MSKEMKRLLKKELREEAEEILWEVERDKSVANLKASSQLDEKLYKAIEKKKTQTKKRWKLFSIVIVFTLLFGTISFEEEETALHEWKHGTVFVEEMDCEFTRCKYVRTWRFV